MNPSKIPCILFIALKIRCVSTTKLAVFTHLCKKQLNSSYGIDTDELAKEIGTPLDTYQGHGATATIGVLSGLTFPFTRLATIRDKVKANQEVISKNLLTTKSNPLSESINFLEGLAPKPTVEKKKSSSSDALMKLMKLQA